MTDSLTDVNFCHSSKLQRFFETLYWKGCLYLKTDLFQYVELGMPKDAQKL